MYYRVKFFMLKIKESNSKEDNFESNSKFLFKVSMMYNFNQVFI